MENLSHIVVADAGGLEVWRSHHSVAVDSQHKLVDSVMAFLRAGDSMAAATVAARMAAAMAVETMAVVRTAMICTLVCGLVPVVEPATRLIQT